MRRKHAPPPEAVDSPLRGERNGKAKLVVLGLIAASVTLAAKAQGTPGLSIVFLAGGLLVVFCINTFRRAQEGIPVTPLRVVTVSLLALFLGMGLTTAKVTRSPSRQVTVTSATMAGAMSAGGVDLVTRLAGKAWDAVTGPVQERLSGGESR